MSLYFSLPCEVPQARPLLDRLGALVREVEGELSVLRAHRLALLLSLVLVVVAEAAAVNELLAGFGVGIVPEAGVVALAGSWKRKNYNSTLT